MQLNGTSRTTGLGRAQHSQPVRHAQQICQALPRLVQHGHRCKHRERMRVVAHADQGTSTQAPVASASSQPATDAAAQRYGWKFDPAPAEGTSDRKGRLIRDIPVAAIRRPLGKTRGNDQDKVAALMASIQEVGLQEPIDVLEVDGEIYGFSGCHRYEAHVKLGRETIRCRVRKATREVLKMHMM